MKRPDFYVTVTLLTLIITTLGLAWGYTMYDDAFMGPGKSNDTLTDNNARHGDTAGIEECREAMSVEKIKAKSFRSNKSCELFASSYERVIYERSHDYSVEPSLVSAVITIESNWDPQAVSPRGAIGLMQLMPATAKEMGVHDLFNPMENIEGGIRYLRYLIDRFDGNLTFAIAAYNAGPRRIERYQDIPPIRETQQYVKRVLNLYHSDGSSDAI